MAATLLVTLLHAFFFFASLKQRLPRHKNRRRAALTDLELLLLREPLPHSFYKVCRTTARKAFAGLFSNGWCLRWPFLVAIGYFCLY